MKYIIDIDALKDCLNLLTIWECCEEENFCVNFKDVMKMIEVFPKEKVEQDKE